VVGERRHQDTEDDRQRPAIARGQHEGEQLRLVADFGDGDDAGRDEKGFHRGAAGRGETTNDSRRRPIPRVKAPQAKGLAKHGAGSAMAVAESASGQVC